MAIIPNWHPVFVHFAVGLLSMAVLFHLLTLLTRSERLRRDWSATARWNLWSGTAFAVLTALTGWYAYNTVAHDTPSHLAMTEHRNWAIATVLIFLVLSIWSVRRHRVRRPIHWPLALALLLAFGALAGTAWRGGELVFRHGLGVMSLPAAGAHDHPGAGDAAALDADHTDEEGDH